MKNTMNGTGKIARLPRKIRDQLNRRLERLKKFCGHSERGFLGFGEASAKEQVQEEPVTEPKRRQNPKRPLPSSLLPNGYSIFENALNEGNSGGARLDFPGSDKPRPTRAPNPRNLWSRTQKSRATSDRRTGFKPRRLNQIGPNWTKLNQK